MAECLLEAGASCSDFTFDGERCYYVALTQAIKQLLLAHAQRCSTLPTPLCPTLWVCCLLPKTLFVLAALNVLAAISMMIAERLTCL